MNHQVEISIILEYLSKYPLQLFYSRICTVYASKGQDNLSTHSESLGDIVPATSVLWGQVNVSDGTNPRAS